MEKLELVNTLKQLHRELDSAEGADPETLDLLRKLTEDIDRLLSRSDSETISSAEVEPVSHGLKSLLLKFEADHPQLSVAVGKVADALSGMGI